MIAVGYLFEDEEYLLFEGVLNKVKKLLLGRPVEELMEDPKVQEFIALSEKTVSLMKNKKVTFQDKQKILKLLKEKSVKRYLEQIDTAAKRSGVIGGSVAGGYVGLWAGLITAAGVGATAGGAMALALLGAASLGVIGALAVRKLAMMSSRWQREGNVQKQASGIPVAQVQLTG